MLRILVLISAIIGTSSLELYDYGSGNGDTLLTRMNDVAVEVVLTEAIPYFNKLYKKAYINDNGLVSMLVPVSSADQKNPLPINNEQRVLIAPFWANVDITEGGEVYYRQIGGTDDTLERATAEIRTCFVTAFDFTATHAVVVTWDRVSFFGKTGSINPTNTFQLVLASDGSETYAFFLYDNIEWNAGTESQGDPVYGTGSRGATIGFNSGDVYKYFAHSRSSEDDTSQTQLGSYENCPKLGEGIYVYKIDGDEIVESGCKNDADLSIFPPVGSMFGGEEVYLVGPCWDSAADIICRFTYNNVEVQTVTGTFYSQESAICVPEPFFLSGELKLEVSDDGGESYSYSQIYTVANLDRVGSNGVTRVNSDDLGWSLSGYDLEVQWDSSKFADDANITISVLSYLEDGSLGPRWEEVYNIAENVENTGSYDFEGVPVQAVSKDNAFGSIKIHDSNKPNGLKMWSSIHAFGYILNQEYQDSPQSWSTNKCDEWNQDETYLPVFVDELIPCPCTLEQAIADSGRFQPDGGCSMYKGSVCKYHQGAKHCVRSVAASETTSSGTQCCYKNNGDLMYAGDTDQGSTADRSHVWGAEPYQTIDTVPGLSHWKHDVITFYYCCIWGNDCKTYLTLRPTADCKEYNPPRSSATFGDPHFVTFDNLDYTFNGKGEFTMVEATDIAYEYELQGRMEQARCLSCGGNETDGEPQQATSLTAIAMAENDADTIHVELNAITTLKFVRKYTGTTEVVEFNDQFWLDFNGVSIVVVESDGNKVSKATITYWNSGIGVNVTGNDQMLSVATILPPALQDNMNVRGLLGNWDNSSTNDLIDRDGRQMDPETATPQEIRDFGLTWEVESPLFYYESGTHDDYQDNSFIPVYEAPDRSTLPSDVQADMDRICGDNEQCIFDMSLTRSESVGELTMEAINYNDLAEMYTQPLIVCPYIATPRNGSKNYQTDQENNLVGAHIIFECDDGTTLTGPEERICQENGEWTGEGDNDCVATGCPELEPPRNGYIDIRYEDGEFIAETVCDDGYSREGSATRRCVNGKWTGDKATCIGGLSSGAKAGIAIGVLLSVAIVLVIVIVLVLYMYKDSGEENLDKGTKVKEASEGKTGENWELEAEVEDASAAVAEKGKQDNKTNE